MHVSTIDRSIVGDALAAAHLTVPDDEVELIASGYRAIRARSETLNDERFDSTDPKLGLLNVAPSTTDAKGLAGRPISSSPEPGGDEVWPSIASAGRALRTGAVTSLELTMAVLERAHRYNGEVGAYVHLSEASALKAAAAADDAIARGEIAGPLQGIPLAIKDVIATADAPTTANSRVGRADRDQCTDSPIITRLRRAGAVLVGKATTHEFGIGWPDPSTGFPVAVNPWDAAYSPSGSSSGSAVAVATDLALGALGTDTGGSVRGPAAACGVTGLKVTFGRVPTTGVLPLAFSLDSVGPIARTAEDCGFVLQAIAGYDKGDRWSSNSNVPDYGSDSRGGVVGLRIGLPGPYFFDTPLLASETEIAVRAAIDLLKGAGAIAKEVVVPYSNAAADANHITMFGEAFAIHRGRLARQWSEYGIYTRRSLARGAMFSAADYVQAQRVRAAFKQGLTDVFRSVDVLLTPTAPFPPERLEVADPGRFLMFCAPWSLAGVPAMSVPVGFTSGGLPLAMQIIGPAFAEGRLIRLAREYQRLTDWHLRVPPTVVPMKGPGLLG